MSYTQGDSLYVGLNDALVSKVIGRIQAQRPSLLNYCTPFFIRRPDLVCVPVAPPDNGAPLFTVLAPIQLGFDPRLPTMEMLIQILDVKVGFGVDIGLPPILQPLPQQRIALATTFAARFVVPRINPKTTRCPEAGGIDMANATLEICDCFTGTLAATIASSMISCADGIYLTYAFDRFDTDNLTPVGLRQTFDSIVVLALDTIVLPKLWVAIAPFIIDLRSALPEGSPVTSITLTPVRAQTAPNPNIANHNLEAWFKIQVTAP